MFLMKLFMKPVLTPVLKPHLLAKVRRRRIPCIVMVGFNNGNHYRSDYYSPESLLVISLSLRST